MRKAAGLVAVVSGEYDEREEVLLRPGRRCAGTPRDVLQRIIRKQVVYIEAVVYLGLYVESVVYLGLCPVSVRGIPSGQGGGVPR